MATTDQACSIHPYFQVREGRLEDFKAVSERCVAQTSEEEGCQFYGFSFDGSEAHCRESYRDAGALLTHLERNGPLLEEALGMSELVRLEVHGPAGELDKLRGPLAELQPRFFVLESGFRA